MTNDKVNEDTRRQEILERALAAGICHANWHTWVRGLEDGLVRVRVDGDGKITGTHEKSGNDINGECTEGLPHLIHFTRTDTDGCEYTYDGTIGFVNFPIPGLPPGLPFFVIVGKVHSSCPNKLDDDDDWMGTHTT